MSGNKGKPRRPRLVPPSWQRMGLPPAPHLPEMALPLLDISLGLLEDTGGRKGARQEGFHGEAARSSVLSHFCGGTETSSLTEGSTGQTQKEAGQGVLKGHQTTSRSHSPAAVGRSQSRGEDKGSRQPRSSHDLLSLSFATRKIGISVQPCPAPGQQ